MINRIETSVSTYNRRDTNQRDRQFRRQPREKDDAECLNSFEIAKALSLLHFFTPVKKEGPHGSGPKIKYIQSKITAIAVPKNKLGKENIVLHQKPEKKGPSL